MHVLHIRIYVCIYFKFIHIFYVFGGVDKDFLGHAPKAQAIKASFCECAVGIFSISVFTVITRKYKYSRFLCINFVFSGLAKHT